MCSSSSTSRNRIALRRRAQLDRKADILLAAAPSGGTRKRRLLADRDNQTSDIAVPCDRSDQATRGPSPPDDAQELAIVSLLR